jgi:hypothetical protein
LWSFMASSESVKDLFKWHIEGALMSAFGQGVLSGLQ